MRTQEAELDLSIRRSDAISNRRYPYLAITIWLDINLTEIDITQSMTPFPRIGRAFYDDTLR